MPQHGFDNKFLSWRCAEGYYDDDYADNNDKDF